LRRKIVSILGSQTRAPFAACIPLLDNPDGIPQLQSGTPQLILSEVSIRLPQTPCPIQARRFRLATCLYPRTLLLKSVARSCSTNGVSTIAGGCTGLIQSRSYDEVEVRDISLTDYINIRSPVYIPHSAGRYAVKRFRKAQVWTLDIYWASADPYQCPIIERLTCSLMMNGRNNGKKLKAVRIIAHSFEIVCCQHAGPIRSC